MKKETNAIQHLGELAAKVKPNLYQVLTNPMYAKKRAWYLKTVGVHVKRHIKAGGTLHEVATGIESIAQLTSYDDGISTKVDSLTLAVLQFESFNPEQLVTAVQHIVSVAHNGVIGSPDYFHQGAVDAVYAAHPRAFVTKYGEGANSLNVLINGKVALAINIDKDAEGNLSLDLKDVLVSRDVPSQVIIDAHNKLFDKYGESLTIIKSRGRVANMIFASCDLERIEGTNRYQVKTA